MPPNVAMSNPLKRQFDPIRELNDDEYMYTSTGIAPSAAMLQSYEQGIWQNYDGMLDIPRQSQYYGPSYMNLLRYGESKISYSTWQLLNDIAIFPSYSQCILWEM